MEIILPVVLVIIGALIKRASDRSKSRSDSSGSPNPRIQRLIERVQAQQSGTQPTQFQGQYTQPVSGQAPPSSGSYGQPPVGNTYPDQSGRATSSAQLSSVLQQLLQAGRQPTRPGQHAPPGRFQPPQFQPPDQSQPSQFQQPGFQPSQPSTWLPSYPTPQAGRSVPSHRPPQNNLPSAKGDIDNRVRELMASGSEVAAVRLLCDEQDMGIIEAQAYARNLVAPPAPPTRSTGNSTPSSRPTSPQPDSSSRPEALEEETRYVGSAAFAESVFDTGADENVWASGWVDKPEPEDRSDMDELWQTVQSNGRPQPT